MYLKDCKCNCDCKTVNKSEILFFKGWLDSLKKWLGK